MTLTSFKTTLAAIGFGLCASLALLSSTASANHENGPYGPPPPEQNYPYPPPGQNYPYPPADQGYSYPPPDQHYQVDPGQFGDYPRPFRHGRGYVISCDSKNYKYRYCPANVRRGVELVNRRSKNSCRFNRNWGYDGRGVWVRGGCRADFAIY